ncbi:acyl-CoA dehydrogenase family protein [Saccharopolyspora taberi]|uniref:Acyl-CoA dehydrogenase family protein n=1 Tax=Saccharopolyspora taberi TaxID=60895 RepID=A0ABN3V9W5_9PSEU
MSFVETDVQKELRASVAKLAARYNYTDYVLPRAREGRPLTELWREAGELGFLGVNLPAEYGGGAGIYELALVQEELAAQGAGLLLVVVSPAICGTVIARYGTEQQRQRWLPGIADGSKIMAFGITEPDAGSNSHRITTTARRDGDDWILSGQKVFVSGVDQADAVLIVARTEDHRTGKLKPALFIVPTDARNFEAQRIEMDIVEPDHQFTLFLDEVRLPADALLGEEDAALLQLFAGLNPERVLGASMAIGMGRYALARAAEYANQRQVWKVPIGAHQGLSHPLAQIKIELELAKLMMQKAAVLYDSGDDVGAGEAANMAKYAAAEASIRALDQAIQTHGGSGLTKEYGLASMLAASRISRIAPVSREMILNFVAQHSLGLPKSY